MAARLRGFTPDKIAILYNSAPDHIRRLMEAASVSEDLIPYETGQGLVWSHLLDKKVVQEAVEGRAQKENPVAYARLKETEELRDMVVTAANIAIQEIREA
jgi:hypothetical protein